MHSIRLGLSLVRQNAHWKVDWTSIYHSLSVILVFIRFWWIHLLLDVMTDALDLSELDSCLGAKLLLQDAANRTSGLVLVVENKPVNQQVISAKLRLLVSMWSGDQRGERQWTRFCWRPIGSRSSDGCANACAPSMSRPRPIPKSTPLIGALNFKPRLRLKPPACNPARAWSESRAQHGLRRFCCASDGCRHPPHWSAGPRSGPRHSTKSALG